MKTGVSTPSALETLVERARSLHDSIETKGAAETLLPLFRKQNRKELRALINQALGELKNQPDVLTRVAGRAAGGGGGDWRATAEAVKDLVADGEDRLKEKRESVLRRAEWVKSRIEAAARGQAHPDDVASAVKELLGEFSPRAAEAAGSGKPPLERAADVADVLERQYEEGRAAIEEMTRKVSEDLGGAWEDAKRGRFDAGEVRRSIDGTVEAARAAIDPAPPEKAPAPMTRETGPVDAPPMDVGAPVAAAPVLEKSGPRRIELEPARELSASDAASGVATRGQAAPVASGLLSARFAARRSERPGLLSDRFLENRLRAVIGRETPVFRVNVLLAALVRHFACDRVGALHVTCTDEAEQDSRVRFMRSGVGLMLPALPQGRGSAVVTSNRGGCYEPGSLSIAARHYGTGGTLALVARLQAHCGIADRDGRRSYGLMDRYGRVSRACGALQAVLDGDHGIPRIADVASTLEADAVEEVRRCDERVRPLLAAVLQARAQVERARSEALGVSSRGVIILFGSVHLNGPADPSEIPVVLSVVDRRDAETRSYEIAIEGSIGSLVAGEGPEGTLVAPRPLT